jgi:hypothetical protein
MNLNEDKFYSIIVELDTIYNLVVNKLLIWNFWESKSFV